MVTNMYPTPDQPAYGAFVKSQIDSIISIGHDVKVFQIDGRRNRLNYILAILRLRRLVRTTNYDLVHAHYGLSGIVACMQKRFPVLVSFCGDDLLGTPDGKGGLTYASRAIMRAGQWVSKSANGIVVKTRQMKYFIRSPRDQKKAVVIPNGVDLELFKPISKGEAQKACGLRSDRRYVLFPSTSYERRKRFDLAEKALDLLKVKHPEVELVLLYHKPQGMVPVFMNACDAMVMTSDWEGSPNVVKEAMACNLPIVSVDAGDAWEVIGNAAHCYRAYRNPDDIADKLNCVLVTGERSNGREHIAHLEIGNVAKRVLAVYEAVLKVS
ncbi:MAG: hypothetical protein CME25_03185 [Gemmatimonadetes bacterium]|nr:hypothetical protein [Gemmatimonadota bacterium]